MPRRGLYEVTEVLDSDCDLRVGDRLSQTEYAKAQEKYGFQRFVTEKFKVTKVHHADVSLNSGDLLTENEMEALKADIRQRFNGEWYSVDSKTGDRFAADDLTESAVVDALLSGEEREANFKRIYRYNRADG